MAGRLSFPGYRPAGVVAACTVGNMVGLTPMVFTVFGLFLVPLEEEFGWSRAAISIALMIIAATSAISYPLIGRMIDRHGARRILLIGNLLFAVAVGSVFLIDENMLHFYLAYAFIGFTGAIPSGVMFTKVIAAWFDRHRGVLLGIVGGLGNGAGAALAPVFVSLLLTAGGWRFGYVGIAMAIALIGFPVLFLLLWDPPERWQKDGAVAAHHATGMTLAEARKTAAFWIISLAVGLMAGCMTAVFVHLVPMLLERDLSLPYAARIIATFSIVTAIWQISIGFILDRFPRPWIAVPFYLLALVGLILLNNSNAYAVLLVAAVLLGFDLGTEYGVLPYFLSRYFGVRHYGEISGMVYALIVVTQGVTPVLMALVFDLTGSYSMALYAIALGLAGGALLLLWLKPFTYIPAMNTATINS